MCFDRSPKLSEDFKKIGKIKGILKTLQDFNALWGFTIFVKILRDFRRFGKTSEGCKRFKKILELS